MKLKHSVTGILFIICVCGYVLALIYYPNQTVGVTVLITAIKAIKDYRKSKKGDL